MMTSSSPLIRTARAPRAAAPAPAAALPAAPQTITALPNIVNLNIYQGDDFYLDVAVFNPDGSSTDLSSSAPQSMIRATPESVDVLAQFTITVDPTVDGLLHLQLPSSYSSELPLNSVWDLQLHIADIATILAGKITCMREVTR